jgi:hypothetical protein
MVRNISAVTQISSQREIKIFSFSKVTSASEWMVLLLHSQVQPDEKAYRIKYTDYVQYDNSSTIDLQK